MSRTFRGAVYCAVRKPKHLNTIKNENRAYEEIKEALCHCHYHPNGRLTKRTKASEGMIPDTWEDLKHASWKQVGTKQKRLKFIKRNKKAKKLF